MIVDDSNPYLRVDRTLSTVQPRRISINLWPAAGGSGRNNLVRPEPEGVGDLLDLVGLTALMGRSAGRREIRIGLIDGPVALDHADLEIPKLCSKLR